MRQVGRILILSLAVWSAAPPAVAQTPAPPPDPRFGAVEAYMAPEQAAALGVGWDRMVVHWYERQPDNVTQWRVPAEETAAVDTAVAAGREMTLLLMGTPAWATTGPAFGGVPRGLYQPVDDPANLWAVFVRRMVSEYAGRVEHWIIWNEPDIAPQDSGAQFVGSVKDYYQLVKVAYLAAKQADPQAVIHLAGVTHWHDVVHGRTPYLERWLQVASQDPTAAAHHDYFDVATLHIYFRTDTVYDLLKAYRDLLDRYGQAQPFWLNETNAAPSDDPLLPWKAPMFSLTMNQQADFLVQAFALALAAKAERAAVYKLTNPAATPDADYYGLYRPDGSARPAVDALRAITRHFAGVRRVWYTVDAGFPVVTLERLPAEGAGLLTRVIWTSGDQPLAVSVPVTPGTAFAKVYDALGAEQPLRRNGRGDYLLNLPAAVCVDPNTGCVVGGAPWLLVETMRRR